VQIIIGAHDNVRRLSLSFLHYTFRITMASSSSSPESSLTLMPNYRDGKQIGTGAQVSVYLLEPTTTVTHASFSSSLTMYAVRIAPVAKITKVKLLEAEINEQITGNL
jgi:hypothetical protein